jgi:hypothetical protein
LNLGGGCEGGEARSLLFYEALDRWINRVRVVHGHEYPFEACLPLLFLYPRKDTLDRTGFVEASRHEGVDLLLECSIVVCDFD